MSLRFYIMFFAFTAFWSLLHWLFSSPYATMGIMPWSTWWLQWFSGAIFVALFTVATEEI